MACLPAAAVIAEAKDGWCSQQGGMTQLEYLSQAEKAAAEAAAKAAAAAPPKA